MKFEVSVDHPLKDYPKVIQDLVLAMLSVTSTTGAISNITMTNYGQIYTLSIRKGRDVLVHQHDILKNETAGNQIFTIKDGVVL